MSDPIPCRDITDATRHHALDEGVGQAMGTRRRHLYVREIRGVFQRLRRVIGWPLMLAYFATPWLAWGERPAVWFDLPSREFHLFGATFYPQEFMLLSWLLIIAAFGLFFITVLAGRLWCGYACPQSVWTQLFIWVEHRLEGPRHRRIRLDRRAWDADKLRRKSAKHTAWLVIAVATGLTCVGYFTPIRALMVDLARLEAHAWACFWIAFFTLFTYLNAGWLREQVCHHMCPYARFQGVMFDADTLTVAYDAARGEPRGRRGGKLPHDAAEASGHGDCIDCELCIQACPTGIDIRDGLQHECIDCAACIDACDGVMERLGYPRGLIRYTSENALQGHPSRRLRPRLLGYLAVLLVMLGLFIGALGDRVPLDIEVERDRQRLFQLADDGRIRNVYTLTVRNLDQQDRAYRLEASGLDGLTLDTARLRVPAGESRRRVVEVTVPPHALEHPSHAIRLHLEALDDPTIRLERDSRFLGETR
ncbi:cytochrome c oxidase accessory protein CcoG [Halomonas borealis]|uniref:cytochrome c oxidase accessory protein CcoG n=1 Tax=Halomonas borealis TaxID=2508710 RepID=UPI00109F7B63|nr:cytochrome c oxidase accessory protein CcoG [Halomonas borealis]